MRVALACMAALILVGSALAQDVITSPDWIKQPRREDFASVWPYQAARAGIGGKAVISCAVDIDGLLHDCKVMSETPEGSGFGNAAVLLATKFKMRPKKINGKPVEGGQVRIPIVFGNLGATMVGGSVNAITDPVWISAPTFEDMKAAYPPDARDQPDGGGAVLHCNVTPQGRLIDCITNNELPKNKGFGTKAKTLTSRFQLKLQPGMGGKGAFVEVKFKFLNPDSPDGKVSKVAKPRWISLPDTAKVQAVYPKQAADAGVTKGLGIAECDVSADGHLVNCRTAREEPSGLGFGDSAVLVAQSMQMNPWTDEGRPVEGATIKLPIRFDLAPEAAPKP